MDPLRLLDIHLRPGSRAHGIVKTHSLQVRDKALAVARQAAHLKPDLELIAAGALVHDIGVYATNAPAIGCFGELPYVCHGEVGGRIFDHLGRPELARICRRHVGVGLTAEDIRRRGLPLPPEDQVPETVEEIIVCYADTFFSKNGGRLRERSLQEVTATLARYGRRQVDTFLAWHRMLTAKDET